MTTLTADSPSSNDGRGKKSGIRVFQSDLLETFTHVHPILPLVMWGPVTLFFMYRSLFVHQQSMPTFLGLIAFALFTWTVMEYTLHRWIFHIPARGKLSARFQFIVHGLHHDDPNCKTRLVMPPVPAIILAIIFYPLFHLIFGSSYGDTFSAGFTVGYLAYDYTHYAIHHFRPRTRAGRYIKAYHMQHHCVDHDAKWGVSTPLWDMILGTSGKKLTKY